MDATRNDRAAERAVIILHEGARTGWWGSTDADLASTIASAARQRGPRPAMLCAGCGAIRDHAMSLWDATFGAQTRVWAQTPRDALEQALARTDAGEIFLLRSGDAWTPEYLVTAGAGLADKEAWLQALLAGSEATPRFFPGWAEAAAFFRKTGLALFHAPLSGLSFRRACLERLVAGAGRELPLGWELGTGMLLGLGAGSVGFSPDPLGSVQPGVFEQSLGEGAVERLRALGADACFRDGAAERFPRLLAMLRPRDVPAWEAQRFEIGADRCVKAAHIAHTPENLVLLALLLELGPGAFEPLADFLENNPGLIHEREYAYAAMLEPGVKLLHDADVPAYAALGKRLWPRSRVVRTHVLARLLRAGRGAQALALYDNHDGEDCIALALHAQCAFAAGDAAQAEALANRLLALPEARLTLIERTAVAMMLVHLRLYAAALKRLAAVRREIPYGEQLAVMQVTALAGLGRREEAAAFVQGMEDARALPVPGLVRLRQELGDEPGVQRLLAGYFDLGGGAVRLAEACDNPTDARMLALLLEAGEPATDAVVREAFAACRGLPDFDKGFLLKEHGLFEAAMHFLSRVPASEPRHVQARYLRAGCLAACKRYDEAEAGFLEVVGLDPGRQDVFLNIIDLHKYRGRWDEAAALAARLRALDRPPAGLARREREIREGLGHENAR